MKDRDRDSPAVIARVVAHLPLVDGVVETMATRAPCWIAADDLVSYGCEGLLEAARRFDDARGVPFEKWAAIRVRGAIVDAIRMHGPYTRDGLARTAGHDASDQCESATPEQEMWNAQVRGAVRASVARLPQRERQLLERLYFDDETLHVAGERLGLSKSWASRLHARAVAAIGRDLRRRRVA